MTDDNASPNLREIVDGLAAGTLHEAAMAKLVHLLDPADRAALVLPLSDRLLRTSALLEVSKQVSETLSLDQLFGRMVAFVSRFLRADRCSIFLFDPSTQELYSRVAQGSGTQEIRFPAHVGIAGHVFQTGQAEHIPDAYSDPRFNSSFDKKTGYRTRNILCAPIKTLRGQTVGVAQVLNKNIGDFDSADMSLLQALTTQAASAFLNAQMHEQIEKAKREETELLEVTNAISTELHLEPLLQKIMQAVTTLLDADRSTLFMFDPRTNELWSHVAQGLGTTEIRFPCHLGIAGSVFKTSQTINIPNAYEDARFNKEIDKRTGYKTDTILCMPVLTKAGQNIGVIQVLNKKGGPFSGTDERRLKAFASQASVAIENAKLFEDVMTVKNYNESILQSMSNGVITIDDQGVIAKANHAALRLWRKEKFPDDLVGKTVNEFFSGKNEWIGQVASQVMQKGTPDSSLDVELWLRDSDDLPTHERRREKASVNLSVVPLTNVKGKNIGCMLMLEDITNEKRLKSTMARYMTKEIADKLLEEGEAVLGGKLLKCSVLFSDIRSFTTISERMGAQETVKMLNEYFGIMVDIILGHGGILDKYIGDAIMAVFGAPFSTPHDTDNAVKAAIDMLKACHQFNRERAVRGQEPLLMGLGVNTDQVLSGNIGSLKRMDYTVIGDGVNLASRLEGANKLYGTQILISEFTVKELTGPYLLRQVDRIRVKGKNEPVGVYEVLDHLSEQDFPNITEVLQRFNSGLDLYRQKMWKQAQDIFQEALLLNPHDGVSKEYHKRCQYFQEHPPSDDWDGVWTMKDK